MPEIKMSEKKLAKDVAQAVCKASANLAPWPSLVAEHAFSQTISAGGMAAYAIGTAKALEREAANIRKAVRDYRSSLAFEEQYK